MLYVKYVSHFFIGDNSLRPQAELTLSGKRAQEERRPGTGAEDLRYLLLGPRGMTCRRDRGEHEECPGNQGRILRRNELLTLSHTTVKLSKIEN